MSKSAHIHDKEIAKKFFCETYQFYIDQFSKAGIELKCRVTHTQKNKIFVGVMLVPTGKKTNYYGKSFFAVMKRVQDGSNNYELTMGRNLILEMFLKHYLKKSKQKSPESVCSETVPNLLLRILFFYKSKKVPQKFKGKDIRWIYSLIYLLLFALTCFLVAQSRIELNQTMGWDW